MSDRGEKNERQADRSYRMSNDHLILLDSGGSGAAWRRAERRQSAQ
jgi:hypothetical protein